MVKILIYILLIAALILNTFFGLGPVILADGSFGERMMTLAIVLMIYILLVFLFWRLRKRK